MGLGKYLLEKKHFLGKSMVKKHFLGKSMVKKHNKNKKKFFFVPPFSGHFDYYA
jgi:hypothetical protein